jgi:hypothetical protein
VSHIADNITADGEPVLWRLGENRPSGKRARTAILYTIAALLIGATVFFFFIEDSLETLQTNLLPAHSSTQTSESSPAPAKASLLQAPTNSFLTQIQAPKYTPPPPFPKFLGIKYTIQRGDTLAGIARRYYGSICGAADIAVINRLCVFSRPQAGKRILIPPREVE